MDGNPEEYEEGNVFKTIDRYNEWMTREKDKKGARYTWFDNQRGVVQQDRADRLQKSVEHFNMILKPYWSTAAHKTTYATIADKMYLKVKPWEDQANECMQRANDTTDSNWC